MYTLIIGFIIFFAILLILVILAQNAKGGGLTSQFGGSSASNIIGIKKTGDLLEKLTWGFVVTIMTLSLIISTELVNPYQQESANPILEKAGEQNPQDVAPTPGLNLDTTGAQPSPADTAK
jgi:preprotein translocase subunit SecG